jgi:hypothetical protein
MRINYKPRHLVSNFMFITGRFQQGLSLETFFRNFIRTIIFGNS